MTNLLPAWPLLAAFVVASFLLAITPGPAVFYIVTRSITHGRRAGLASVAGVALGNLGNAVGASVGLAALFAISAIAFTIVKCIGALYLIYIGVQILRSPRSETAIQIVPASSRRLFREGFVVALFNPKTTIFFAAFLPQFMSLNSPPILQSVALGSMFVGIAAMTDTTYALAAGSIAPIFAKARGVRSFGRYLSGGAFIGLGVLTAVTGSNRSSHSIR